MASAPRTYTRLTRTSASFASYRSLWLAADHLLIVTSTGYTESYQRVQLRDIQGFFVIDSPRRLWFGLPWTIVAILSASFMVGTLAFNETPYVSPIFFVLSLTAVVWNFLLGPGCRVFFVTSVQTAELPSLVRRRKAQRVIARLQPLIVAEQSNLAAAPVEAATPTPSPAPAAESSPSS